MSELLKVTREYNLFDICYHIKNTSVLHVSIDLCDFGWYELEGCFGFCIACYKIGKLLQEHWHAIGRFWKKIKILHTNEIKSHRPSFIELKVFFQNLPLLMMCFIRSPLLTLSLLQTAQLNTWLPVSTTKAVTRSSYLKSEHSATVLIHFTLAGIIHILNIGPFVHYKWISVLTFSICSKKKAGQELSRYSQLRHFVISEIKLPSNSQEIVLISQKGPTTTISSMDLDKRNLFHLRKN